MSGTLQCWRRSTRLPNARHGHVWLHLLPEARCYSCRLRNRMCQAQHRMLACSMGWWRGWGLPGSSVAAVWLAAGSVDRAIRIVPTATLCLVFLLVLRAPCYCLGAILGLLHAQHAHQPLNHLPGPKLKLGFLKKRESEVWANYAAKSRCPLPSQRAGVPVTTPSVSRSFQVTPPPDGR